MAFMNALHLSKPSLKSEMHRSLVCALGEIKESADCLSGVEQGSNRGNSEYEWKTFYRNRGSEPVA